MPTYSPSLRLVEQDTGSDIGSWGTVLNTGMIDLIDFAVSGMTTVGTVTGTVTLTANDGIADQARSAILNLNGALTGALNLVAPALSKIYIIYNNTTNNHIVTINTTVPGTALTLPQGSISIVFCDGTNFLNLLQNATIQSYKEVFYDNGTTGGAITANYLNGNCQKFTLNANSTLSFANVPANLASAASMVIKFVQDATGSRTLSIAGTIKTPGGAGITLSTAPNAIDILMVYTDDGGTTYDCSLLKGYA